MEKDPRVALIRFLQARLRPSAFLVYQQLESKPQFRYELIVGHASWTSHPANTAVEAKKEVASVALADLKKVKDNAELKRRLGLYPHPQSCGCDMIRAQLCAARNEESDSKIEIFCDSRTIEQILSCI